MPCFWIGDKAAGTVLKYDPNYSVVSSFTSPATSMQEDISIDNNNCIWHTDSNTESIYKTDQLGSIQQQADGASLLPSETFPPDYGFGVGKDGCIWIGAPDSILGQVKGENAATLTFERGSDSFAFDGLERITVDGNRCIWIVEDAGNNDVAKANPSNFTKEVSLSPGTGLGLFGIAQTDDSSLWFPNSDPNTSGGDQLLQYNQLASFIGSFAQVPEDPTGITISDQPLSSFGGTERLSLWVIDRDQGEVGKQSKGGTEGTVIDTPGGGPWEVALDTDGSFWHVDVNNNCIYKFDKAGSIIGGQNAPSGTGRGMAYDGSTGCIWHTDESPSSSTVVYQLTGSFDPSLSIVKSFKVGLSDGEGMTSDKQGCIWIGHDTADKEIRYNQNGSIVTSFTFSPSVSGNIPGPQGISDDNSLWLTASETNSPAYKLNHTGSQVTTYSTTASTTLGVTTTQEPVFALGPSVTAEKADTAFGPTTAGTGGTGTIAANKTDIAFYDTVAPLGGTGTTTAVKTPMAFSPIQPTETLVGTAEAITEAFSHRVNAGQPARLWWDTASQWESPQKSGNVQVTDGDEIGPVSGSGYIIPTDQNWEGDN